MNLLKNINVLFIFITILPSNYCNASQAPLKKIASFHIVEDVSTDEISDQPFKTITDIAFSQEDYDAICQIDPALPRLIKLESKKLHIEESDIPTIQTIFSTHPELFDEFERSMYFGLTDQNIFNENKNPIFKFIKSMHCVHPILKDHLEKSNHYLSKSIEYGNVQVLELLVTAKLNINRASSDGWTLLHFACYYNKLKAATFLVNAGANIHATLSLDNQYTPLDIAKSHKNDPIINALTKAINNQKIQESILIDPINNIQDTSSQCSIS